MSAKESDTRKNKKRLINMLFIFGAVATLCVVVVVAFMLGTRMQEPYESSMIPRALADTPGTVTGGRGLMLTPETLDEVREELARPRQATHFTTSMNTSWEFPSGTEPSTNATVGNSTLNDFTMYFDVVLVATGEVVFSSPFMPVGTRLEYFALDVPLPPGEHDAIATFTLVDDDFEDITDVHISVLIQVLG
jgi:hypothetical protein